MICSRCQQFIERYRPIAMNIYLFEYCLQFFRVRPIEILHVSLKLIESEFSISVIVHRFKGFPQLLDLVWVDLLFEEVQYGQLEVTRVLESVQVLDDSLRNLGVRGALEPSMIQCLCCRVPLRNIFFQKL